MVLNASICSVAGIDADGDGNSESNCTFFNSTVPSLNTSGLLPFYVFFSILAFAGLVGNILIIVVILAQNKSKSAAYVYILNLAIADLLMLTMVPFLLTTYITNHAWIFGTAMCHVYYLVVGLNMFNVVFILMSMSVDRYFSASRPFRSLDWKTRRKAKFVCCILWIFATINDTPYVVFADLRQLGPGRYACMYEFPGLGDDADFWNRVSEIYVTIISFIIPLPVITVTHICIISHMRRHQPEGKISRRQYESGSRREFDKTTRMVTAVVVVFLICWLPKNIVYLANRFSLFHVPREAHIAVELLLITNSAINPYLYTIFGENFRDSLKDMCCSKRKTVTRPTPPHANADNIEELSATV